MHDCLNLCQRSCVNMIQQTRLYRMLLFLFNQEVLTDLPTLVFFFYFLFFEYHQRSWRVGGWGCWGWSKLQYTSV